MPRKAVAFMKMRLGNEGCGKMCGVLSIPMETDKTAYFVVKNKENTLFGSRGVKTITRRAGARWSDFFLENALEGGPGWTISADLFGIRSLF